MSDYSFSNFIEEVKDMDLLDILEVAERRCQHLESISWSTRGAVENRIQGSSALIYKIKYLLFWLRNGIRPAGISDDDFNLLRKICANLVKKKQLKPESLKVFE